jgi:hypothetical protein
MRKTTIYIAERYHLANPSRFAVCSRLRLVTTIVTLFVYLLSRRTLLVYDVWATFSTTHEAELFLPAMAPATSRNPDTEKRNQSQIEILLDSSNLTVQEMSIDINANGKLIKSAPPSSKQFGVPPQDAFSACLLVMDENFRLSEWIAYHFFTLPLRTLVVLVDPRSRTSPKLILDQWREYMDIVEWTDGDILFNYNSSLLKGTTREKTKLHRTRQKLFYGSCTRYLKATNRSWTTYFDVDEYLAINEADTFDSSERIGQSGSIIRLLRETKAKPRERLYHGPCITLPRRYFSGSKESTVDMVSNRVPDFLNASRFETLRWRYRSDNTVTENGASKAIMDVSQIAWKELRRQRLEVHRPIKSCPPNHVRSGPFSIHHYLGTWEAYSHRNDARDGHHRKRTQWELRSDQTSGGSTDQIRPWIAGFVQQVGKQRAAYLLHDVGIYQDRVSDDGNVK